MTRSGGFVACVVVLCLGLGACVTRAKHQNQVDGLNDSLDAKTVELNDLRESSAAKLAAKQDELAKVEAELDATRERAEEQQKKLAQNLKASMEEIKALEAQRARNQKVIAQYRELRERLKEMISAGDVDVYQRRGRIMLALPSAVLFPSGKARLSRSGRRALAKLAPVLADLKERRFLIAGHTDNVPIGRADFEDNWELSATRALNVTRFLVEKGVPGEVLAASGYSQFDPVRKNNSAKNRRRNRRIEIVLMPDLADLDLTN